MTFVTEVRFELGVLWLALVITGLPGISNGPAVYAFRWFLGARG